MGLQEVGWARDWIDLALDKDRWRSVVNAVKNVRVSQNSVNFLSS